jgi:hypothetical protein
MPKTYYISESQFKTLMESKREQKKTLQSITEEIDLKRKTLSEGTLLNEGIIDTVKKYWRAGALTAAILGSLLSAQKVDAQQLQQAGIPTEMVQQAMQQVKHNPNEMTTKQIDNRLVQIMRQNNLKGAMNTYQQLNPQQKENILQGIKSKIKSLDDINHISIGDWEKYDKSSNPNAIQYDQKTTQKIRVETVDTVATVPLTHSFQKNSVKLVNPQQLKATLDSLVSHFTEIDSITINASSSTLRNKGEAEGMTWKQLSQTRADEVAQMLVNTNIDLGGEGVNLVGKIAPDMIKINSNGTNGDGTSGPKSPYEVNPEYVKSYQDRGIDPKLWQSAAQEDALPETQLDQYDQYQYVTIIVHGRVVTTATDEVPSYKHIVLQVKKSGGKVETGQNKKVQDISKCPVMIKTN